MATFSDNTFVDRSSPRFEPPQSAQPFASIFRGPSSQDAADLEPYPEQQDADDEDQDELDVIMGEQPVIPEGLSDDESYRESDEDGYGSDGSTSDGSEHSRARKKGKAVARDTRNIESSPPPDAYRPNRFRGPESTWRKLTVEDRQNVQALEALRAKDLAAHLYNAYALRVRAREMARQAIGDNEASGQAEAFLAPKRWTAWPMPSTEVPRVDEHIRREKDDAWTLRVQPDPRPSSNLEESIIAAMLKSAKERFQTREWENKLSASQNGRERGPHSEDDGASTVYEIDGKSDSGDDVQLRPVVQADDDKSRRQLRPIARNTITQLDQLLMGLHNARRGGVVDDSSASEWQSDTGSVVSDRSTSPRKRRAHQAQERSQSRGRKRTRRSSRPAGRSGSVHASNGPASSRQTPLFISRSRTQSRGRSAGSERGIRHGIRDWSEVLGVASMIGWSPAVVMRAAKRCNSLFGEDMAFRTFKEGKLQQTEKENEKVWEYWESESEEERPSPPPPQPLSRVSSKRSRSRAASGKSGSVSRPGSPSVGQDDGFRPKGKGEHRKLDLVCPFKKCSRHEKGFSRVWNLNLHMKRMHQGYRPRSTDAKSPANVHKIDDE